MATSKKRRKKKKSRCGMKCKLRLILIVMMMFGIGWCVRTVNLILEERNRLNELDVYALNLPFIVNYVDDIGGDNLQLNWKELVAIIGVASNNNVAHISENDLDEVSELFLEGESVVTFKAAALKMGFDTQEMVRAHDYLKDLETYGYVPYKLEPLAMEMQFINAIKQSAMDNYYKFGILPSITIAQAILESNWGQSDLAQMSNNLFGIKKGIGWEGETVMYETKEYFDQVIVDEFRSYQNVGDSITDHAKFLVNNKRYGEYGVFDAKTYRTQAKALENAGYSTAVDSQGNKTYAKMLGELIRQYNLQLIDHAVGLS